MIKPLTKKILILTIVFLIVVILTKVQFTDSLDRDLTLSIYNFLNNDLAIKFFSFITNCILPIAIVLILVPLLLKKKFKIVVYFAISYLIVLLVSEGTKFIVNRSRPFKIALIDYLGGTDPTGLSFPSGHTMFAFFLAHFVCKEFKLTKTQTILVYFLASLVAFSRIYLGAHYVLDVIGGAILGTIVAIVLEETGKLILM